MVSHIPIPHAVSTAIGGCALPRWHASAMGRALVPLGIEISAFGLPPRHGRGRGDALRGRESNSRRFGRASAELAIIEEDRVVERIPVPCAEIYDVVLASSESVEGLKRGFNTNQQRVAAGEPIGAIQAVGPDAHLPPTATELPQPG